MSPILKPLAAHQDQSDVVSGLANAAGDPLDSEQRPALARERLPGLNGMRAEADRGRRHSGRHDDRSVCGGELGKDTPLRSLELALEPNFMVGNCEGGYSCAYINTMSWRTPTTPLPMETNPRVVFERLFGDGGDGAARLEAAADATAAFSTR